jgi:hypothetical protein
MKVRFSAGIWNVLNRIPTVQECDATMPNNSNVADFIIKNFKHYSFRISKALNLRLTVFPETVQKFYFIRILIEAGFVTQSRHKMYHPALEII